VITPWRQANPDARNAAVEDADSDEDGQRPEFSLVTGQYRKAKRFGGAVSSVNDEGSSAIVLRNEGTVSVLRDSAAGAC